MKNTYCVVFVFFTDDDKGMLNSSSSSSEIISWMVKDNLISKGVLKHLTIKINGKSSRRFDRSSVIIKLNVRSRICIDIYTGSYKEVRLCENINEIKIWKKVCKKNLQSSCLKQ